MPSVSQSQQSAAGIALAGHPKRGSAAAKMKASMSTSELRAFAKTRKKGLPKHVQEQIAALTFKDYLAILAEEEKGAE